MKIKGKYFWPIMALLLLACNSGGDKDKQASPIGNKPNIVYILADDLGYGDLSIYNPDSKISTPNMDAFAREGIRFTDAHAPSSVCTPSRYSILTGEYCWRSRLPQSVLSGYGRALIEPGQQTVASFLQKQQYKTAVIGKWHLGLDWVIKPGHDTALIVPENDPSGARMIKDMNPDDIDFSKPPTDGPLHHGFDYSYILPASLDMAPYCYLENDILTSPLSATTNGNELNPRESPNYATGAFWRPGPVSTDFDFNNVLEHFTNKAVDYIHNVSKDQNPFFLYFAMPAPHTPWLPSKEFVGKSKAGAYGDYVEMVDAMIGKVLEAIDKTGEASNTIVIVTSDNGPYWRPAFIEKYDHHSAYLFRGMKADAWEGGHRVPFMVRWPGHIKAASQSNITTTLTNLFSTCAELTGDDETDEKPLDSYSVLPVLLGRSDSVSAQQPIMSESSHGLFAVRRGEWKLIAGRGSGGFSDPVKYDPKPGEAKGQLYDIKKDPSETNNQYQQDPKKVEELTHLMDSIKRLNHNRKN